jgi:hypothetical protein
MGKGQGPEVTENAAKPSVHAGETALTQQAGTALSTPAVTDSVQRTITEMDKRMDNEKLNLTYEQLQAAKSFELAIVAGDAKGLSDRLAKLSSSPGAAEHMMDVVVQDLKSVGIDARWSYTSNIKGPGYGEGYYLRGHEDVGHLTLANDNKDGTFTSVTYSTEGSPTAIRQPIPTNDGKASQLNPSPEEPASALKAITDVATKANIVKPI